MERCQCCGRHPAKRIAIKIKRGFPFSRRRQTTVDGTYCRDCAQAAYSAAEDKTGAALPPSLDWGDPRRRMKRWNSAKLGDLPPEVKDEPWIRHRVACPHCRATISALAGPVKCDRCARAFVVGSCVSCGAVHTIKTALVATAVNIPRCRACGHHSEPPLPVRNWSELLVGQAVSEVAAKIVAVTGTVSEAERLLVRGVLRDFTGSSPEVVPWLEDYFERCIQTKSSDVLSGCVTHCKRGFRKKALQIGIALAETEGPITPPRRQALGRLAGKLGLDLERELSDKASRVGSRPQRNEPGWWDVLQVPRWATIDQIEAAYRSLARQHHPDRLYAAAAPQRKSAEDRMKAINGAFAEARAAIDSEQPPAQRTAVGNAKKTIVLPTVDFRFAIQRANKSPIYDALRVVAWIVVVAGFVVLVSFWFQGLNDAIEYESKHMHDHPASENP